MGYFTIILAVIGVVAASPLQNNFSQVSDGVNARNSVLENLLLGVLEGFRETMQTGSDTLPVLDPFQHDNLHLDLGGLLPESHLTLTNVEARHLSTFVIDDLSLTLISLLQQRYDLEVEGHIPVLNVDADHYDLSVTAIGFTVFGAGQAKIVIREPRIILKGVVGISIVGGISLNVHSLNIVFRLGSFEPQLTGLFGDTISDQFVNLFLKNLVEDLLVVYENEISEFLSEFLFDIINGILGSFSGMLEDLEMARSVPKPVHIRQ